MTLTIKQIVEMEKEIINERILIHDNENYDSYTDGFDNGIVCGLKIQLGFLETLLKELDK